VVRDDGDRIEFEHTSGHVTWDSRDAPESTIPSSEQRRAIFGAPHATATRVNRSTEITYRAFLED
jgi:hypothetical protein